MMTVDVLASSSAANCTFIDDGDTRLLLDAGMRLRQLRERLGFNVGSIAAACVTHEHGDHSRGVSDLTRAGVDCHMLPETAEAISATGHRIHGVVALEPFRVGSWGIRPIPLVHDVPIVGYVLDSDHGYRVAYLTDSAYVEYQLPGVTHMLLETNFCEAILRERVMDGSLDPAQAYRVRRTHLGLERAVQLLKANDLSRLVEVHALHLSAGNSDEQLVKSALQAATGKPVYVAAERTTA